MDNIEPGNRMFSDSRQTEQDSMYRDLEKMSVLEILTNINAEDQRIPLAVQNAIPAIEKLVRAIVNKLNNGGRVFYIGAGSSGRLGVLDASETVPTFGVDPGLFTAVIAGGDAALRSAVEFAEDDIEQGWTDLQEKNLGVADIVIGISASGSTPYVVSALQSCRSHMITTGCVTCNANMPIATVSDLPVEILTGPEFLTGSTRMKAGTAQKMALNMISTSAMIQIGRVQDNKMINMQLSNQKLLDRAVAMLLKLVPVKDAHEARQLLQQFGSVKSVLANYRSQKNI